MSKAKKHYISWPEFYQMLDKFESTYAYSKLKVYGVPKGGMIVAGFLSERFPNISVTHDPKEADLIIDDILDSGKTARFYQEKYNIVFDALIHRKQQFQNQWVVFPWEADHPAGEESVEDNITRVLEYIGEDPDREGLKDTPKRVVKSWKELYAGYNQKSEDFLTVFESEGYDELVLLKDIEMYSMCEHHMLPFYGRAHVAYIPDGKIVGISKLARIVDMYSKRLQNQERITQQVVDDLMTHLSPKGAACVIEAKHMCMCARGVGKQNSVMTTSSMRGVFRKDPAARAELTNLLK